MKKSGFMNLCDFLQRRQFSLSFLSTAAGVFLWTCSRWLSPCAKAVCWIITSGLTWCRGWGSYRNHCIPLSCFSSSYFDCIPLTHTCASPSLLQESVSFSSYRRNIAHRPCCASSAWEVVNKGSDLNSMQLVLYLINKWLQNYSVIALKLLFL